jgi:hypothetical protein
MVMPVSSEIPKRLQEVMDDPSATRIHGFWFHEYNEDKRALIWYVPANQPVYILHGYNIARVGPLPKDVKDWVKENLWRPYYFETIIDGQKIVMQRFSAPLDFDGTPPPEGIGWYFYHIFEPGDLSIGEHEFDMIWYSGVENGERKVDTDIMDGKTLYEAYCNWFDIDSLIIHVG